MTPRIPENVFTWFADWGPVTIMVNTMPPRDPNDDDDEGKKTRRTRTSSRRS